MNKIYTILFVLMAFCSCNPMEDIYDNLDGQKQPVSSKVEYTLTDADYKTVGELALKRKTKADSVAGTKIKDKKYFADDAKIAEYLPDFLAGAYPGLQKNSSVIVTYNYFEGAYPSFKKVVATVKDYQNAGGDAAKYYSFTGKVDAKVLPKLVSGELKDGDQVLLTYKMADAGFAGKTENVFDFTMDKYDYKTLVDWVTTNQPKFVKGDAEYWFGASSANRNFEGRVNTWKTYPHTETVTDAYITSQIQAGIKLLLETKFAQKDASKQAVAGVIYNVRYAVYSNSNIPTSAAFLCKTAGSKPEFELATTPVNAAVTKDVTILYNYVEKYAELQAAKNTEAYIVNADDFKSFGFKFPEFTSTTPADNYLPQLLAQRYVYAQPKDELVVIYQNDGGKNISWYSDRYQFNNGTWTKYNPVIVKSDQFIYNSGKWVFDPTVQHTMVKADYDIIVQWVKDNKNSYFDANYKNAEYWFGASTFKDNFDVRLTTRKANDPDNVLKGKSDAEVVKILNDQIQKGIELFLETAYKDAEPIKDGMEMYYKVTYLVYDGSNHTYVVTYKCISVGKFELSEAPVEL